MNSVVKLVAKDVDSIPFQEASLDIWDKKYRLVSKSGQPIDQTMDETYQRVARALAGAQEHKPATSTINCTVSGTIRDSMDDILGKVHEAGLTLKAGCASSTCRC